MSNDKMKKLYPNPKSIYVGNFLMNCKILEPNILFQI